MYPELKTTLMCYSAFANNASCIKCYVWRLRFTWCWGLCGMLEEADWSRAPYWAADLADWPTSLRQCSWSRQRAHFMVEPSH